MSSRAVVNLAKAFGYILAVAIIGSMITGILYLVNLFNYEDTKIDMTTIYNGISKINNLKIKLKTTSLEMVLADEFKVETNNGSIKINQDTDNLEIEEKDIQTFNKGDLIVKIYVPSDYSFENVKLEMGAGKSDIEYLKSKDLTIKLGAGKNYFEKLEVTNAVSIDGGVGLTEIEDGTLNNLDLDAGVGKIAINAEILGTSKIHCGVGELDLDLKGDANDYQLDIEKGIGSINVDGKSWSNNGLLGNGNNKIKIAGGIGSINVKFKNPKN